MAGKPEKTGKKQGTKFKPGKTGNPNGRPRGARNKTTIAVESLLNGDAEALTRKAIERALEGDAGLTGLADDVANTAGKGRETAKTVFRGRTQSSGKVLQNSLADNLTDAKGFATKQQLIRDRSTAANKAYEDANSAVPMLQSPGINDLIKHPTVSTAIKQAKLIPNLADLADNDMRVIDAAYKNINKAARAPGATYTDTQIRKVMFDAIGEENPAYTKAATDFAQESAIIDAIDEGKKVFRMAPDEIKHRVANMTAEETEAFRIGAADTIKSTINKTKDVANKGDKIVGNRELRERLLAIFPSRGAYKKFMKVARAEDRFQRNANEIVKGSQTRSRQSGGKALAADVGAAGVELARGNPLNAASHAIGSMWRNVTGPSERMADSLAPMLFNQNQTTNEALVRALMKKQPRPTLAQDNSKLAAALMYGAGAGGGSLDHPSPILP